jgi:hypothetical protein
MMKRTMYLSGYPVSQNIYKRINFNMDDLKERRKLRSLYVNISLRACRETGK